MKNRTAIHRSRDQQRRSFLRGLAKLSHRPRRLGFEGLEDRNLLATLYVDSSPVIGGPGADQFTASGGSQANAGGLTLGTDLFTTISDAVTAANPGDVINVSDGLYLEDVSVNKSLTFFGNQFGNNPVSGPRGAESIVDGNGTSFSISANDVVLDGFTIQGQTFFFPGAAVWMQPGTSGTEVRNNIVQNNVVGIFVANNSAVNQTVIEDNLFQNNTNAGPAGGHSIYADQFTAGVGMQNVLIDGNRFANAALTVDSWAVGISNTDATPFTNITVSNNEITNHGRGMYFFSTDGATISGNTISGTSNYAIGIFTALGGDNNSNFDIQGNTLTGNNRGIWLDGYAGTLDLIGNTINGGNIGLDINDASGFAALNLTDHTMTGNTTGGSIANVGALNLLTSTGVVDDVVSITGANFQHTRAGVPQDAIAYSAITTLGLNTDGGDDVVNVQAPLPAGTTYNLSGGPHPTGDTLNFNAGGAGVTVVGNTLTAAGSGSVTHSQFESLNITNDGGLTVVGNGGDNTLVLRRTGLDSFTYQLDGGLVVPFDRPSNVGTQFQFNGLGGTDTLVIDQGGFSEIVDLAVIVYDGGTSAGDNDALIIRGQETDGGIVARETYRVGATEDAGTWVLDSDGSMGPGATGAANGDETIVSFVNLEPVDSDTPAAIFDLIMNGAANQATIENGGLLNGASSLQVTDNNASFETTRFANKTAARIMGQSGGDSFRLNATTNAAGLTTLEVYGHVAGDVVGQPADDNGSDRWEINATLAGVVTSLLGQGGSDLFHNNSAAAPFFSGTFSFDNYAGTLNITGGETGGDADQIALQDAADLSGDLVTLTATQILGAGPSAVNYAEIETLFYESTQAADTINVLSTALGTNYYVNGDGGADTITLGNEAADFGTVFDGSLDAILGNIVVAGDRNAPNADDTLNVDDSGTAALNGPASITIDAGFGFDFAPFFGVESGAATVMSGFAPATIRYLHAAHTANAGNRMEFVNVLGSSGDDVIDVGATTALNTTTLDTREGNDAVTISGDNLSAANLFTGNTGNDSFVLNVASNLGATAAFPIASLQINGNDPALDSENRDTLAINDNLGPDEIRSLALDYQDGGNSDLDVSGFAVAIDVNTIETVSYTGTGNDNLTVLGTSGDDDLTVAPTGTNSALVFLGGNPWDGPGDGDFFAAIPGLAGGGTGPDLNLNGVGGLLMSGDGAGASGDQLYVYGVSETDIVSGTTDYFGFGAGVVIPGSATLGLASAYDFVQVFDVQVAISAEGGSNPLLPVDLDTASFTNSDPLDDDLIVNTGFEALPGPGGVADDIVAFLSADANFGMQINGGDPDPSFAPSGDRLQVFTPAEVNVYSDKQAVPNVTVTSGGSGQIGFSSIEYALFVPGNGVVNLIGDNNDPAGPDQTDNFVVVGQDTDGSSFDAGQGEFSLEINGSAPIFFDDVQFLNAFGHEEVDTLEVTPYADNAGGFFGNQPRGWGIDVFFDEGLPNQTDGEQTDLLIYHTSAGLGGGGSVSENIEVVPSGPDSGELRVTNAADGSVILVLQYVANTDIVVIDDDGSASDTDTLTLYGTNPEDSPNTSGNETVTADFTEAGDAANPWVTVNDGASILYRLRNFSGLGGVNFALLDGNDSMTLNAGTVQVDIDAGRGNDTINASATTASVILRGGEGDDTLTGGTSHDRLEGGDGNDTLTGGPGSDHLLGGADGDTITAGGGDALVDGGTGDDILNFNDGAGDYTVAKFVSTAVIVAKTLAGSAIVYGIEDVNLGPSTDGGNYTVFDLSGTSVRTVNIATFRDQTGASFAAPVSLTIHGSVSDDNIDVGPGGSGMQAVLPWGMVQSNPPSALLTLNGLEGNDNIKVSGLGATAISLNGGAGDDYLSADATLIGGAGNDTLVGGAGNNSMDGGAGDDTFIGNGGTDSIADTSGNDTILLPSTPGLDDFSLSLDPTGTHLLATVNGVTTTYNNILAAGTGIDRVKVDGGEGSDSLTVDSTTGLLGSASALLDVYYDGGPGVDNLQLIDTGAPRDLETVLIGALPGSGFAQIFDGGVVQQVTFENIEPVQSGVNATDFYVTKAQAAASILDGDNAISYQASPPQIGAGWGRVSVDNFEPIDFQNKTNLIISAQGGSDTINLNNPNVPTGLTSITVNGGDPTASDTVIVNGTSDADTINVALTAIGAASITGAGPVPISASTIEHVVVNANGNTGVGEDVIDVTTPQFSDLIVAQPDDDDLGSGTVRVENLVPIRYQGLGVAQGRLRFSDTGGGRPDILKFLGTSGDDSADVGTTGAVFVRQIHSSGFFTTLFVETPGVDELEWLGLDGNDDFSVVGDHPFSRVVVEGGNGDADRLFFESATIAAINLDLGSANLRQAAFGRVQYSGTELLNIGANSNDLTVDGDSGGNETLDISITGENSGQGTSSVPDSPLITFTNVGALSVDLLGGDNTLKVHYGSDPETIGVDGAAGIVTATNDATATALEIVNFANIDSLRVYGNEGNDAFIVTPAADMPIFIDGGDPIGTIPGDSLIVNGAMGFFPGPESDEGGYLTPGETVSFDHIESLAVNPVAGCPFLIIGTNADDDITVIARDASTHALADGVQDFTFSINAGPDVLVLNAPDLYIDALSGDDDIVIRAPAPNDADWDVNVRVAGGPPSIGESNEADRLVLETPGQDSVVFNPTGPDTGNMVVDEDLNGIYDAGGTDSLITFGSFVFVCTNAQGQPVFTYTSSPGGVELVEYDGEGGDGGANDADDDITINGTSLGDTTTLTPSGVGIGVGVGSFVSGGSPVFHFRAFDDLTVNGGSDGFDQVIVNATEGPDVVTSDTDTIFFGLNTTTLGAGIDQLSLNTFGGNDSITLSLAVADMAKVIDAGAGNDNVDVSAMLDATIYGGDGDDVIIGSPLADLIFGGRGNDTINGGGGNDQLYGEDGNDVLDGDAGADQMFGGDGSDTFVWDPGDGSDLVEGGAGESDILVFNGSAGAENFDLNAVGTRLELLRSVGTIDMDIAGVETIDLNTGDGGDSVIVRDLFATDVRFVDIDSAANGDDSFDVRGRNVSDNISIAFDGTSTQVTGLKYDIRITGADPVVGAGGDRFILFAGDGNDTITTLNNLAAEFAPEDFTLNGNQGDDYISGYGNLVGETGNDSLIGDGSDQTLDGGNGDDYLVGGFGVDLLLGGPGEDTLVLDFDGAIDTFDGGVDFDTILVRGTSANDVILANQAADNTLVTTRNGTTVTDTLALSVGTRTIERVRIEAGSGDDLITVTHADSLGTDAQVNSVLFDVDGGPSSTRDRLGVIDGGTGDLLLYRKGENDSAGSISIGPGNVESLENVFENVEFIQPVAAALGQVVVFKHDPNEWNDDQLNSTHVGAGDTLNLDPNIDPGGLPAFGLPGDQDYYRVVAEVTGTLDFQVYFTQIATVPSGRPGLPGNGDLNIEVRDAAGNVIAGFGVNDATSNERVRIPAVQGQSYFLRVFGATELAINNYSVTVINNAGPTPYGLELDDQPVGDGLNSDTGRSQFDDITRDNTPTIVLRLDDGFFLQDLPGNSVPGTPPDEVIPIPFRAGPAQPLLPGYAIAIFDEGPNPNPGGTAPQVPLGFATQTSPGVYQFTSPVLADGSHFLSARVQLIDPAAPQQTGFTARSALLEIVVDTVIPPVSLGQPGIPDDGVISDSDTGVSPPNPDTIIDRITFDTTPTFWGRAEADTIIRVYADVNDNGTLEVGTDVFLGQDTTIPLDGTNQEPDGYWEVNSIVSLNDPDFFPVPDGLRTIFVTAEDVAGNTNAAGGAAGDTLQIFVDTQGPQVTDVDVNNAGNPYDLFDPKPSTDGPTPLVNSLVVSFRDLPNRLAPDFLYPALKADVAASPGNYLLVGDYNGIIPISQVIVVNNAPVSGSPATATVTLVFFEPLPDDRFTLTVSDSISDPVGNALDGESNADEPQENPIFPSGDRIPGGDFVARFTVDTRPEVGAWGAGSAWIDTNGNTSFDPDNLDFTNRDISYILGLTSDDLFAGNFALGANDTADGFDKLAAYGRVNGAWRWMVDTDNDGVPNVNQIDPAGINGLPVAGNFDGNAANGDEVGIFTGSTWWFDTDHDFRVDTSIAASAAFIGYPVVGDFDGDGFDDLGAWSDDTFVFNLSSTGATVNADLPGLTGSVERTFRFGFSGPNERPVAADMNQDGFDDIGLFVPNRAGASPDESAEWYILVSGQVQNNDNNGPALLGPSIIDRIVTDPITSQNVVRFTPVPFGNDAYIEYGDEFGLPILGNFDPPATLASTTPGNNTRDPLDVNNDGKVSAFDALLIINHMNQYGPNVAVPHTEFPQAPYLDVSGNGLVSASDALAVINHLNLIAAQNNSPSPEGEADEFFSELGQSDSSQSGGDGVLAMLANDLESQRRRRG